MDDRGVHMNANTLRFQHCQLMSDERSFAESTRLRREALKQRAEAAGLGKLWRELESPAPPFVSRIVEEPTLRARVLESFSGQWRGMPYDAPAGTVADFPASYVKHAPALFERVDDSTPLSRPAPSVAWPR